MPADGDVEEDAGGGLVWLCVSVRVGGGGGEIGTYSVFPEGGRTVGILLEVGVCIVGGSLIVASISSRDDASTCISPFLISAKTRDFCVTSSQKSFKSA